MPIDLARRDIVSKPWGTTELRPWSYQDTLGALVGEIWFSRGEAVDRQSALLVKLLFTRADMSIQVHPDDAYAKSVGLPNGKNEAWYVLSADSGSRVALGLKVKLGEAALRAAMADGTIADLVAWRPVEQGQTVFVPAGCIHAIGPGLVLAEVQQRSDTTYRLFDHGRSRELHVEDVIAVADAGPPPRQSKPVVLTPARTLLKSCPHFVLEKVTLLANSAWWLNAGVEMWVIVLSGQVRIGSVEASRGEAIVLDEDHARVEVGPDGVSVLVAYPRSEPLPDLLERPGRAFEGRDVSSSISRRPVVPTEMPRPNGEEVL
jgi:mannose-6-phosphate isomerase